SSANPNSLQFKVCVIRTCARLSNPEQNRRVSASMNSPLVLISLPAELIARVADDSALSKHDLMRLRLTCRLLNFWATYSLAQQHLSKIGSLSNLQASAIRSHIRSIQLDHTRVHPDQVAILADAMVQAKQSGNDGYPKAKERFQGTSRRFVDELELEDSEEALQSLIVAFSALKTYDNPITLTSADTHLMGCDFSHTRITEFFGPYVHDEPKHTHLNSTMRMLLRAASSSGLHIECFQFPYWEPRESRALTQATPYIDVKICSKLEILKIEFESPLSKVETLPLQKFLAAVTHVKTFELNLLAEPGLDIVSIRETQFCQEILQSIAFGSLTSVELWNFGISQKALSMFLKKHSHTLQSLKIVGSSIFQGSWLIMLAWVGDQLPRLVDFHAESLYEMQDEDVEGDIETRELFPDKRYWKLTAHGNNECIRDEITKLLRDASNSGS
ncbi:hypothetical protein D6C84_01269, partial [Aureobasidium pullulans]